MDKYRLFNDNTAPLNHGEALYVARFGQSSNANEADEFTVRGGFVPTEEAGKIEISPQAIEKIAEYLADQTDDDIPDVKSSPAAARTVDLQTRLSQARRSKPIDDQPSYFATSTVKKPHTLHKRNNTAKADFLRAKRAHTAMQDDYQSLAGSEEVDLMVSIPGQVYTPGKYGHEQHLHQRAQASYQRTHGHKRHAYVPDTDERNLINKHIKNPHAKTILTAVATLTGLYLIFGPMLPGLLKVSSSVVGSSNKNHAQADQSESKAIAQSGLTPPAEAPKELAVNQVGWVNIPAIGVGAPIVEGKDDNAMTYGVWHRPGTGTPLTNSNTVLAGHRYQYLNGPRTFYSLDKVKAGDLVEVKWGDQKFTYRIVRSFVVSKDKMFIEAPTTVPLLTVYTCTPLWTSTNRLVIQATPI